MTVGTLDPGKTQRATLSTTLPTGQSASGKFVIAVIDATNTVVETNEAKKVTPEQLVAAVKEAGFEAYLKKP